MENRLIVLQRPIDNGTRAATCGEVRRVVQAVKAVRIGIPATTKKPAQPIDVREIPVIDLYGDGELYRVYEETFEDGQGNDIKCLTLLVARMPKDAELYEVSA